MRKIDNITSEWLWRRHSTRSQRSWTYIDI